MSGVLRGFWITHVMMEYWNNGAKSLSIVNIFWILSGFQFGNENFFARSRKSRNCAETYIAYVAQAIPQIDDEIALKNHFRMETKGG